MRRLLIMMFFLSFAADASTEIRLGVHNFPPYFVMKDNDNCGGEAVELTREILQTDGVEVRAICATPARLYKMLSTGEVDLTINIKQTKALPDNISFVEPPYVTLSLVLLSYIGQTKIPTSTKPTTIAAIRGFDYLGQRQILSDLGYQFIDMPDSIDAIKMFVRGRTDALLTYEAPFDYYLKQQPSTGMQPYQRKLLESIGTFYVISDQSPHKTYIGTKLADFAAAKQISQFRP